MSVNAEIMVFIILESTVGLVTTVANILVCYVILGSPTFRKKPMYLFVTSLAAADLLVGAIVVPFGVLSMLGIPMNNPGLCIAMLVIATIPSQVSIFSLMSISFERYLAISYPYQHLISLTGKKSQLVILVTWIASCLIALLPIAWNDVDWMMLATNGTTVSMLMAIQNKNSKQMHLNGSMMQSDQDRSLDCMFAEILNGDYLLFKFVIFGITPLLVCVFSYSVIFLKIKNSLNFVRSSRLRSKIFLKRLTVAISSKMNGKSQPKNLKFNIHNENVANPRKLKELRIDYEMLEKCGNIRSSKSMEDFKKKIHHPSVRIEDTQTETESDNLLEYSRCELEISKVSVTVCLTKSAEESGSAILKSDTNTSDTLQPISLQEKHIRERLPSVASTSTSEISFSLEAANKEEAFAHQARRKKEIHVASVLGMIVMAFVVCWMPIHILNAVQRFGLGTTAIPSWGFSTAILLSHANSMINFFLYAYRLKTFRNELKQKVLFFIMKKHTSAR